LIEIGVRCVVAAGWAVDDDAAYTFAETFYRCILQEKFEFGDAVFEARRETYRKHGTSITWGAYQAYGDPGWRLDPRAESTGASADAGKFVAQEELIDQIDRIRINIYRRREAVSQSDAASIAAQLKQLLGRSPRGWLDQPEIKYALAAAYADLGIKYFEQACKLYRDAIAAEDKMRRVPIAAIEQLANLESQLAEIREDPELAELAVARLRNLYQIAEGARDDGAIAMDKATNAERASVMGSAYKRKAAIFASKILAGDTTRATVSAFNAAVQASIAAYEIGMGKPGDPRFDPYPALNALSLKALEGAYEDGAAVCLACAEKANESFMLSPDVWNAVMAAEAYLVESLCRGAWSKDDTASEQSFEQVCKRYADALTHIQIAPKHLDSVTQQLCLLALLFDAKGATQAQARRTKGDTAVAQRLRSLADRIQPGSCKAPENAPRVDSQGKDKPAQTAARRRARRRRR
jgi:hypothetical protein